MYNLYKITGFILIALNFIIAQVSINGIPKSDTKNMSSTFSNIILPELDHDLLLAKDLEEMDKNMPYRFGNPFEVNFNLHNSGTWENIDNGRVWRLSITSKNAYSINLLYDKFIIPEGAELYVYDKQKSTVLGAFTSLNNKSHETFATSPTKGDVTVIEY